jgi:hypothetical protein
MAEVRLARPRARAEMENFILRVDVIEMDESRVEVVINVV